MSHPYANICTIQVPGCAEGCASMEIVGLSKGAACAALFLLSSCIVSCGPLTGPSDASAPVGAAQEEPHSDDGALEGQSGAAAAHEAGLSADQESRSRDASGQSEPDPQAQEEAPRSSEPSPAPGGPFGADVVHMAPACKTLFDLTNDRRSQKGAPALSLDACLCRAAQVRVEEMAASKLSSHTRPNGRACFTVLDELGIPYGRVAENIASGFSSARAACEALCESPSHYESMTDPLYAKAGMAMARDSQGACYWVQIFSE